MIPASPAEIKQLRPGPIQDGARPQSKGSGCRVNGWNLCATLKDSGRVPFFQHEHSIPDAAQKEGRAVYGLTVVKNRHRLQAMEASTNEFPFVASLPQRKQVRFLDLWDEAKEIAKQNIVPPAIAARLLNMSRQRVFQLMEKGSLPCVTWQGHDFVPLDGLIEFAKLRRPTGRPRLAEGVRAVVVGWKDHCKERISEVVKKD